MRILVLSDRYPPAYEGGYELMCQRVVDGLRSRGHELEVLTTTWGEAPVGKGVHRLLWPKPVRAEDRGMQRWHELVQMLTYGREYRQTRQSAKGFKPDLIFIWHFSGASPAALFAALDTKLPIVYVVGSTWLIDFKKNLSQTSSPVKNTFRSMLAGGRDVRELDFRKMILVSSSLTEKYMRAGFTMDEAVVIPNGIPQSWIDENSPGATVREELSAIKLLYAGRIEAAKGAEIAVEAMNILIHERKLANLSLEMVGRGDQAYIDTLVSKIKEANLENVIHFMGFLPQDELRRLYRDHDLFLFPSIEWEGFGMTILEAMSQGLPVIATAVGGPGDIIQDGVNGLLIEPGSPQALAAGIESLLDKPGLRSQMSQKAISAVKEHFIFEENLEHYAAYLQSCLAQGRR